MPPVLTCVVGKQLCRNPLTDDHWSLRDLAATTVAVICRHVHMRAAVGAGQRRDKRLRRLL